MDTGLTDPKAIQEIVHPQRYQDEQNHNNQANLHQFKPPLKMKVICGYLYFIQGVLLSLPATMPLVYPTLPPYWVLSIFSAASLPFSFKFIEAPFIEKFTNVQYGKRKTWIIISQIMASFTIFISSFFTSQNRQVVIAIFFLIALLFITLQDISLDAMAIKELRIPYLAGITQAILQTCGVVLGGLIFLKLSSPQFASSMGLTQAITTPAFLLRLIAVIILVPTILLHFFYQERVLESQKKVNYKSLWEIIKYYKTFLNLRTKYFQFMAMFLLLVQGFNFFAAGYEFELVHGGFKRNTINTIINVSLIPVTIISIIVAPRIEKLGWAKCMIGYLVIRWVLYAFLLATFPKENPEQSAFVSIPFVSMAYLFIQGLDTFYFILASILINGLPVMGASAMFITMLNSGSNFGQVKAPALALIDIWGWRTCSIFGLVLQIIVIGIFPKYFKFANSSPYGLPEQLSEGYIIQQDESPPVVYDQLNYQMVEMNEIKDEFNVDKEYEENKV